MNYLCGKNNPKRFHCVHKNQAHMLTAHVHSCGSYIAPFLTWHIFQIIVDHLPLVVSGFKLI